MKPPKRKAAGGYHTTTTAFKKSRPNIAPDCKKRHMPLKRCGTVILGAEHTIDTAGNLPDSEVFSRPEFLNVAFGRVRFLGLGVVNRKATSTAVSVCSNPAPPAIGLNTVVSGFQSHTGAKTMTNVISLASLKASRTAATPAITTTPALGNIERQQAIENALSTALYFIRQPHSDKTLQAATGRAIRAVSMLKHACIEAKTGGAL
jgi:hypothetical protein